MEWICPFMWLVLAFVATRHGARASGLVMGFAGLCALCWQLLFFAGSPFTRGWETDSPTHVAASYHFGGFLASNTLPVLKEIALVVAYALAIRRLR